MDNDDPGIPEMRRVAGFVLSLLLLAASSTVHAATICATPSTVSHGDIIVTIGSGDTSSITNAAFTASRTWTLPAASSLPKGCSVTISDFFGGVTASNTLVVAAAGSDKIVGNTTYVFACAFAGGTFESDGQSPGNWTPIGALTVCPGNPQGVSFLANNESATAGKAVTPCVLTDAATVAVDASCSNNFTLTLTTSRTLGNPSNLRSGQHFKFLITQPSGGSAVLTWGSNYKCVGGIANCALSTAGNAIDLVDCDSLDTTYMYCSIGKAFAAGTPGSTNTWNPSTATGGTNSSITLSGGNLTATATLATTFVSGRATTGSNTGTKYWEVVVTYSGNQPGVGVSNTTGGVGNGGFIGDDNVGIGYYGPSGSVYANGGVIATLATYATGTVVCIALDLNNGKIWFRPGVSANWNNDVIGNQNPATNTGGILLSTASALTANPVLPAFTLHDTSDSAVARFSSSAWGGTAPAGFTQW